MTIRFSILSSTATDVVALGQSRKATRQLLRPFRSFRRTPDALESDQFMDVGVMATYDHEGNICVLEFSAPASVLVSGVELMGRRLDQLVEEMERHDLKLVPDDLGGVIQGLEVGIYAPDGLVEGVQLGSD